MRASCVKMASEVIVISSESDDEDENADVDYTYSFENVGQSIFVRKKYYFLCSFHLLMAPLSYKEAIARELQ